MHTGLDASPRETGAGRRPSRLADPEGPRGWEGKHGRVARSGRTRSCTDAHPERRRGEDREADGASAAEPRHRHAVEEKAIGDSMAGAGPDA